MSARILVIEDDLSLLHGLLDVLVFNGYDPTGVEDGSEGLKLALGQDFDLIILDLMLPSLEGMPICQQLRARKPRQGIIMLTAKGAEKDMIKGFQAGTDDYISKPFSPRELVARVRAVLRRTQGGVRQPGLIRVADLEIDLNGHTVRRAGQQVSLSRTEFNLLATLAQNPGQTFTRAQLLDRLHGVAYDGYDRSVDAHVKNLRHKLEADPANPRYVLTVYGIGYKFTDEP